MPIHPVTEATAEIIARIGSEQAAHGMNLPLADLIIGACALELGYAIGTHNARGICEVGTSTDRLPFMSSLTRRNALDATSPRRPACVVSA